ncbi:MAG: selenide, water dikinase SelD, partial [Acidobacteriota bacterium]|nr:selenide, water dikinase SelD [Acidobacteriota bacterium]
MVQVLRRVSPFDHSWVDPNLGSMEDAALLRPETGPALAFTVDFITPIVDDPETYGAIAAANALSDVYAMGGEPQVALAICGFPRDVLPLEVLERIFRGGRDKAAEAGCAIAGGHTVLDPELKYGLCVIGSVEGSGLTQTRAEPGDLLVLTKPLGFGIAAQAIKEQKISRNDLEAALVAMTTLNKGAKDAALAVGARAATDVTGFGLLGHLHHLAAASGLSAKVRVGDVPKLGFASDLAGAGVVPGGSKRNLEYAAPHTRFGDDVAEVDRVILSDAQTSGGLLIAVP